MVTKDKAPKVQVPTIGRIVLAVVAIHEGTPFQELVTRPAIIVRVWPKTDKKEVPISINAQVFMDGDGGPSNDGTPNAVWKTSLQYDASGETAHSWRWPKRG